MSTPRPNNGLETLIKRKNDGTVVRMIISGKRPGGRSGGRPRQEIWQCCERVRLIASALQTTNRSQVEIAREFGVTGERVRQINNRYNLRGKKLMSVQQKSDTNSSAEGVAAPLEPSRQGFAAHLEREWMTQGLILDFRNWLIEKLWTAAAVSKSLTDKYAEMEAKWMRELLTVSNEIGEARASVDQLCGDVKAIQQDYSNEKKRADRLEKEITALRETQ